LILLIVLILILASSGGFYGHRRWGYRGSGGIGCGGILLILLVIYMLRHM
jgi:hypothetical protein